MQLSCLTFKRLLIPFCFPFCFISNSVAAIIEVRPTSSLSTARAARIRNQRQLPAPAPACFLSTVSVSVTCGVYFTHETEVLDMSFDAVSNPLLVIFPR